MRIIGADRCMSIPFIKTVPFMNMYGKFSFASDRIGHIRYQCRGAVPLMFWKCPMKKLILITLIAATALSPMAASATDIAPRSAEAQLVGATAQFQQDDRRGERRGERRGDRRYGNGNGNADNGNRVERRDATQDGRYYDRNRDGNLDRRWDRNRDDRLDRSWDRNRDGRLDRRYDRNDDERIDRRFDRNRNGQIDRRYDRDNDDRVDRWSSNWRSDRRYDWRGHRQRYGHHYRPGRYYSPYRDRGYNRISIGFSLGSGYYGQRYWINDPWNYRLPAAYGPYRWVRYYDDVLLVDVRSGRVVDAIQNFFW
jgi:hypothetical protein